MAIALSWVARGIRPVVCQVILGPGKTVIITKLLSADGWLILVRLQINMPFFYGLVEIL